jgi:hypothetical protein
MFWAILVGVVLLVITMLWLRDRGLKKRGKTPEQISAASQANVASYVATARSWVPLAHRGRWPMRAKMA